MPIRDITVVYLFWQRFLVRENSQFISTNGPFLKLTPWEQLVSEQNIPECTQ